MIPVGTWRMRTAESAVFTPLPRRTMGMKHLHLTVPRNLVRRHRRKCRKVPMRQLLLLVHTRHLPQVIREAPDYAESFQKNKANYHPHAIG